jgi:Spy/CpxP family protein refolding chaperone
MKKLTALLFAVALTLSMSSLSFAQDTGSGDKKMDKTDTMDKKDKKEKKEKKHKKEKKEKKEKKDDAKGGEMK